uniref:Unannotated protein n=1 Tax=freshwater metagenome TaxID=449393 RepID=A0A6J5ZKM2_9ZZZZ
MRAAVIGAEFHLAADVQGGLADPVAGFRRQQAVIHRQDPRPRARRVKAAAEGAVLFDAKRVFELVAVAPLLDRGNDRLELKAVELADPPQRVLDLLALDLKLALVGEHLPRSAGMVGERLDPVGAGLNHLEWPRLRKCALALCHFDPHEVAGNGVANEDHVAAVAQCNARYPLAAVGKGFDPHLKAIAAVDPCALALCCWLIGHRSEDRSIESASRLRAATRAAPSGRGGDSRPDPRSSVKGRRAPRR